MRRTKADIQRILSSLGRDPTYGRTQGRAGAHLNWKDKLRNRNSKIARRQRQRERDYLDL